MRDSMTVKEREGETKKDRQKKEASFAAVTVDRCEASLGKTKRCGACPEKRKKYYPWSLLHACVCVRGSISRHMYKTVAAHGSIILEDAVRSNLDSVPVQSN